MAGTVQTAPALSSTITTMSAPGTGSAVGPNSLVQATESIERMLRTGVDPRQTKGVRPNMLQSATERIQQLLAGQPASIAGATPLSAANPLPETKLSILDRRD